MTGKQAQINFMVIQICYFITSVLFVSVKGAYSYAPAILLLLSLPIIFNIKTYASLNRSSQLLLATMLLYVLVQGFSILWDGGSLREFDRPSKALVGSAIFILGLRYPPRFLWLMVGVSVGAIGAGIRAVFDRFISGDARAFGFLNPIQGGNISMTLSLLSLCGVMWAIKTSNHRYTVFFTVATVMGLAGSILSQSRGGWIVLPVIIFIFYRIYSVWFPRRLKQSILIISCILIVLCIIPQSTIPRRFNDARQDISLYFSGITKNSSLGLRLEFWKSALDSFAKKPLFGWGNHGIRVSQELQYRNGLITKETYEFGFLAHNSKETYDVNTHAHNQFLDEMAKRGLIGLVALLALFLFPLYIFKQQLNASEEPESKTFAACGIVLVLSTMGYCLSQAFLNGNVGTVFYCVFIAYFLSSPGSKRYSTQSEIQA